MTTVFWLSVALLLQAAPPKPKITNLQAASGKPYMLGEFAKGAKQYIDRDYSCRMYSVVVAPQMRSQSR